MAIVIATGFVVDDAIVVMENITRHLEAGMEPVAAALQGAQEIGFTVFSISMSLIAVFIPILMMGGIIGRLFREFAVTLSTAIVISMVISLTTTPTHVRAPAQSSQGGREAQLALPDQRKRLQRHDLGLPAIAGVGPGQSGADAGRASAHHCAECSRIRQASQGLFPATGHGHHHGPGAGSAGRFLSLHEFLHDVADQRGQSRSCRGPRSGLHRRR